MLSIHPVGQRARVNGIEGGEITKGFLEESIQKECSECLLVVNVTLPTWARLIPRAKGNVLCCSTHRGSGARQDRDTRVHCSEVRSSALSTLPRTQLAFLPLVSHPVGSTGTQSPAPRRTIVALTGLLPMGQSSLKSHCGLGPPGRRAGHSGGWRAPGL